MMRFQGRVFVDVQDLARITNGSLSFNGGNLVLTLSGCEDSERRDADLAKQASPAPS